MICTPPFLARVFDLRPGEAPAVAASAAFFFALLCAIKILRAMRETVSTIAGIESLPDLWTYTFLVTLIANVAYWGLANRVPRRRFVPWSLHACAAILIGFYALLAQTTGATQDFVCYAFYAWYSAFNLCVVTLFWVCMVDAYGDRQSRRLFGLIAVGGTLGAILGSKIASWLVTSIDESGLFVVAAISIEIAVLCNACRERIAARCTTKPASASPPIARAGIWEGLRLCYATPTLRWLSLFIVTMTAAQTAFYFAQVDYVRDALPERSERVVYYGDKEAWTDTLTLVLQIFVTSRLLQRFGIASAFVVVPLLAACCVAAFCTEPSLGLLMVVHATWDAGRHGLVRPARSVLFTSLGVEARYKTKTFVDTVLYRGSDVAWGWLAGAMAATGGTLALLTIPALLTWGLAGAVTAQSHDRGENGPGGASPGD